MSFNNSTLRAKTGKCDLSLMGLYGTALFTARKICTQCIVIYYKIINIAYFHECRFIKSWILYVALVMCVVFSDAIDFFHADVSKAITGILA
jgi:hypothetical protein